MNGSSDEDREERFDEVVADYLDAVDAGAEINEEEILEKNPDLAESLKKFFLDHRRMGGMLDVPEEDAEATEVFTPKAKTRGMHDRPTLGRQDVSAEVLSAEQVGDYLLLSKIAQGGMGVVYKARQISLNRIVAVKMIRDAEFASEEEIQRFQVEAEAAAALQHPGIVPIYQIGNAEGQHYFSMAYVEGQSLAQMVRDAPMHPKKAAIYVSKVARAVHYAHEQGIIHRDLKPANVLVDRNDEPMVTDFGLAKQVTGDNELTMSGQILGTASYMPPEQAGGKADQISAKSDVYSLGALLYALLTQRPPFTGDNPMDVLLDVLSKEPDTPSSLNISLSRDLETICMKCLEKEPKKRYATAEAMAEDLERFLEGKPIVARRISKIERGIRWCKRRPFIAATVALGVSLVVGLPVANRLGWTTVKDERPKTEEHIFARAVLAQRETFPPSEANRRDRILVSAADAMLTFEIEGRQASYELFESTVELVEQELNSGTDDIGLKLGLADCLTELARSHKPLYTSQTRRRTEEEEREVATGRKLLDSAEKLLNEVREADASTASKVERRLLSIAKEKMKYAPGLNASVAKEVLKQQLQQGKRNAAESELNSASDGLDRSPSKMARMGIVQFDLEDWSFTQPPSDEFQRAHALCVSGDIEGAIYEYKKALRASRDEENALQGTTLRQLVSDLRYLSAFQQNFINEVIDLFWNADAESYYNIILGIRMASDFHGFSDVGVRKDLKGK